MLVQDEIEKLAHFYPVIQELPPRLKHAFWDASHPIQAGTDEVLFDYDTTIQSFHLLSQGSIRVFGSGKERELLLYRVQPGSCCVISICHLLDDTRFQARAQVETPIRGIALPRPLFREMVEQSPNFCDFIMHAFADRYTQLLGLIESVTSMQLRERLAGLLVSRGTLLQTTHSQLADELGSVREVISRILKDFEVRGLVKLERGQIQVLDLETLQAMSEQSDPGHILL